eukprot:COSAG02_NODE_2444_length_8852_cov_3.142008_2_plen_565_part_00
MARSRRAREVEALGLRPTEPHTLPVMIRPLAYALLLDLATSQQLIVPSVTDGGGCDWGTLPERVQQVDNLCCFGRAGNPGARCGGGVSCDVACAEKLLPFLSDCRVVVNKLFDADDGIDDDIAGQFDSVYSSCMAIEPTQALAALADLKHSGQCTDARLDGVAETPVSAQGGRHRLQTTMECDLVLFPEQAEAVDAACCDDGGSCAAGVPTTCDAKCALVFAPFFESCGTILQAQVDMNSFSSYERLHDTCATGLPVEPLLRAAAVCSTAIAMATAIIVIGGYDGFHLNSGERYDPAANAWSPIAPMGKARASHAAVVIDGLLYAIGGIDDSSVLSSGERYDPVANTWSPIASMGTARRRHATAVIDGLLYAIGGIGTFGFSILTNSSGERYDPAANAWSPIASMETARQGHATAVIDGLLYAIGGNDGPSTLSSGERYDPVAGTWSPIASMGTARNSHATAVIDGLLYAIGGDISSYRGTTYFSSCERYDPVANAWSPIASMDRVRATHAAAAIDGLLYAIGGAVPEFRLASGTRYNPANDTWSPIASMFAQRSNVAAVALGD